MPRWRLYNLGLPVRSRLAGVPAILDISRRKWSASAMTDSVFPLTRRRLLAGLGTAILGPAMPSGAAAQGRTPLMLQAKPGAAALRPGQPDTPVWSLLTSPPEIGLRFRRGDQLEVMLGNDLPVPVVLNWHGIDGAPAAEPLAARPPLASGAKDSFAMPLRHAGTFLCDLRLLGDGQARPLPARALVVGESETGRGRPRRGGPGRRLAAALRRQRDGARQRGDRIQNRFTPSTGEPRSTSARAPMNA